LTFEYGCGQCGIVEVQQSMKDDKLVACPKCTSTDFQRLITGGNGFQLKGDGWAADGYTAKSKDKQRGTDELK